MNDSDSSVSEDDDPLLEHLLSPLKSLTPPLETRIANRAAVAGELSRLAVRIQNRSLPWWRRTIPVPLPIAASLILLIPASFVLQSRWVPEPRRSVGSQALSAQVTDEELRHRPMSPKIAIGNRDANPAMEFYETEVYLCGVGRLSSETEYVIREQ